MQTHAATVNLLLGRVAYYMYRAH